MIIIILLIQSILTSFNYIEAFDPANIDKNYMIITTKDEQINERFFEKFGGMFIYDVYVKKDNNSSQNSFKVYDQENQEIVQYLFEFDQPIDQTADAVMLFYYQLELLDTSIFSMDHYQFLKENLKIFYLYVGKKNKNFEKVEKYKLQNIMFFNCFDWRITQQIIKSFNETQVAMAEFDYLFVLRDKSLQTDFDMDYQLVYDFDSDFRIQKFIQIEQFQKIDDTLEANELLQHVKEQQLFALLCITDDMDSQLVKHYIKSMDEIPKIYISQIVLNTSEKFKEIKKLFNDEITENGIAFIYYKDDRFQTEYRNKIMRKEDIVKFEDDFFHHHQKALDGEPSGEGSESEEEVPTIENGGELQLICKKIKDKKIKQIQNYFIQKILN